jgi:hypothetical protein
VVEALRKLPTISSPSLLPPRMRRAELLAQVTRFLGLWPSKADQPAVYLAGVCATLSVYLEDTVIALMDPVYGIAARSTFLPTLAELRQWCEDHERKLGEVATQRPVEKTKINQLSPRFRALTERYEREFGKSVWTDANGNAYFPSEWIQEVAA